MRNGRRSWGWLGALALLGGVALLGGLALACARPAATPERTATPAPKPEAPTAIVQVAQPGPGAAPAAPATGWQTEAALRGGIKLLQTFDSSGPPAWDAHKHPLVYFTSNGPGYAGLLSSKVKLPGLTVIDAMTKEVVTARWYDLKYGPVGAEFAASAEPHSLGVSSDGQWIYLPNSDLAAPADDRGRLMVINARTLKLHQVIGTQQLPHHSKSFTTPDGKSLILAYDFGGSGIYILDPNNENKVVALITDQDIGGRRYLAFTDPKGEYIWASVRPASGVEADGWVSLISTKDWKVKKNYTVGESPIWVVFTADGKFAYVDNGHDDTYTKIDIAKGVVVGTARNGGSGPYGMALNWDETELWFISKGEGSHHRGKTVSYVDPIAMGRPKDELYTGCVRGDHIYLHPDPAVNELWLSCNSSFETVVFDPVKKEVKVRIPNPDGGSTHSGAFVKYAVDAQGNWKGDVLSDHNGLKGATLAKRAELAAQAAAKK